MKTSQIHITARKTGAAIMALIFTLMSVSPSYAQGFALSAGFSTLPEPGIMVGLSADYKPSRLKGLKVYPENPFRFDFILEKGNDERAFKDMGPDSVRLIRYFLASLTIPESDMWVNLSPYEKDRIIANEFGQTEMGRDLLAQDYLLKQITASMIYPEGEVGKRFWAEVYKRTYEQYGTSDIPMETFNKVWIIPEKAVVFENENNAFVVESRLKVMLDGDYALLENSVIEGKIDTITNEAALRQAQELGRDAIRKIVVPLLEKEVNEGLNFAPLRQVYESLILATWFKEKVKASILDRVYVDKKKIAGVDIAEKDSRERIYQQYLKAFKMGVFNYIKEEVDPLTDELLPRKYFSGGFAFTGIDQAMTTADVSALRDFAQSSMAVVAMRVVDPAQVVEQITYLQEEEIFVFGRTRNDNTKADIEGTKVENKTSEQGAFSTLARTFSNKVKALLSGAKNVLGLSSNEGFASLSVIRGDFVEQEQSRIWNKGFVATLFRDNAKAATRALAGALTQAMRDSTGAVDHIKVEKLVENFYKIDDIGFVNESERQVFYQAFFRAAPIWQNAQGNMTTLANVLSAPGGSVAEYFGKTSDRVVQVSFEHNRDAQEKVRYGADGEAFINLSLVGFQEVLGLVIQETVRQSFVGLSRDDAKTMAANFSREGLVADATVDILNQMAARYANNGGFRALIQKYQAGVLKSPAWDAFLLVRKIREKANAYSLGLATADRFQRLFVPLLLQSARGKAGSWLLRHIAWRFFDSTGPIVQTPPVQIKSELDQPSTEKGDQVSQTTEVASVPVVGRLLQSLGFGRSIHVNQQISAVLLKSSISRQRADEIIANEARWDELGFLTPLEKKALFTAVLGDGTIWKDVNGKKQTLGQVLGQQDGVAAQYFGAERASNVSVMFAQDEADFVKIVVYQKQLLNGTIIAQTEREREAARLNGLKSETIFFSRSDGSIGSQVVVNAASVSFAEALRIVFQAQARMALVDTLPAGTLGEDARLVQESVGHDFALFAIGELAKRHSQKEVFEQLEKQWATEPSGQVEGINVSWVGRLRARAGSVAFIKTFVPMLTKIMKGNAEEGMAVAMAARFSREDNSEQKREVESLGSMAEIKGELAQILHQQVSDSYQVATMVGSLDRIDSRLWNAQDKKMVYQALFGNAKVWKNSGGSMTTFTNALFAPGGIMSSYLGGSGYSMGNVIFADNTDDYVNQIIAQMEALSLVPLNNEERARIKTLYENENSMDLPPSLANQAAGRTVIINLAANNFGQVMEIILKAAMQKVLAADRTGTELGAEADFMQGGLIQDFIAYVMEELAGRYVNTTEFTSLWMNYHSEVLAQGNNMAMTLVKSVRSRVGRQVFSRNFAPVFRRIARGAGSQAMVMGLAKKFNVDIRDAGQIANTGGIDFNAARMNLDVSNKSGAIQLKLDPAMITQLENMTGFAPQVMGITPLTNLFLFLGVEG
jgi:hypothetical protein